jgi:hypothetical protein
LKILIFLFTSIVKKVFFSQKKKQKKIQIQLKQQQEYVIITKKVRTHIERERERTFIDFSRKFFEGKLLKIQIFFLFKQNKKLVNLLLCLFIENKLIQTIKFNFILFFA